jgi:hypothetical protein
MMWLGKSAWLKLKKIEKYDLELKIKEEKSKLK